MRDIFLGGSHMLTSALIYLLAAVVAVPIAKRLGLGSVLGYLIAGVLIGPYVLHLVGDQTEVMHFAEFGVVMMLFLIGLELRPGRLWELRRPILGLGGLQVGLSALAIALAVWWIFSLHLLTSIAIGLSVALSSTAIVIQSLTERGLMKSQAGSNAFSVLLFQDIAVIPILALLPLLAVGGLSIDGLGAGESGSVAAEAPYQSEKHPVSQGDNHTDVHDAHGGDHAEAGHQSSSFIDQFPTWLQVLITVGVIVGIVVVGRLLAAPVFRYIAETRLREVFTAFALLLVIAIAVLMQSIGLSPALGTFLAGVVLADSEFRHELETDIEPFKGLLLGLFFITVGASIDFPLLVDNPLMILGLVVGLFAIKIAVLAGLAALFKMEKQQGWLFALALSQGGEFAFVLVAAAGQFQVFDSDVGSVIILVVALSMLISPLLLVVYEWFFSRPEQQEQEDDSGEMDEDSDVIIAGYGRFGQIIGRLLAAQGHKLTILDHSPSQIDMLRRFGNKVYYGDASQYPLLEAAGAAEAKLLVVAVDEPDKTLDIIQTAQKHFPHLKILARAIDRRHTYELLKTDIDGFRRETFDSALHVGVDALQLLGYSEDESRRAGDLFAEHDEESIRVLAEVWGDDKSYGVAIRQRIEDLQQVLQNDRGQP
jgi:glutathione-regulated potassium-efflux system ancillary protein KefC